VSGSHGSGDHRYGESGNHRPAAGGQYRSSGPYPRGGSGSHRIVHSRPPRRRRAAILIGAVAGVALCLLAVFVVLGVLGGESESPSGGSTEAAVQSGGSSGDPGERSSVPDACTAVSDDLASELAPNADRTQSDTYQASDRQNQCVWGLYTGKNKRVLTVELRAVTGGQGQTGTVKASQNFESERNADEDGKGLRPDQRLTERREIGDLGEEAYAIYAVDDSQKAGEAVVNLRHGNVLITVHYSGGNSGSPLGADEAIEGATAAAKEALTVITKAE
jgi:hypothetical protein